eukprot:75820-Rhodomonas_salina.2
MSQPRFNLNHPQHPPQPEFPFALWHAQMEQLRPGAIMGGVGSAFAPTARAFSSNLLGPDILAFQGGLVSPEAAGLLTASQQAAIPPAHVLDFPLPVLPTPAQQKEREEHQKAFYEWHSANYRGVEYNKTKLIRKCVHTEATRVLTILKSGRHPSEADVDNEAAAAHQEGAAGGAGPDQDWDRDPAGQPRKRARKMPRRFYHYSRVYILHNYSGTCALAYRPDAAAGGDADGDRAGKPPRMVTCYEDVFDAMANVHYKKDHHVKVGLTEKMLREMYYNIPRNCVKAFLQTCKCQTSRLRTETHDDFQRHRILQQVRSLSPMHDSGVQHHIARAAP